MAEQKEIAQILKEPNHVEAMPIPQANAEYRLNVVEKQLEKTNEDLREMALHVQDQINGTLGVQIEFYNKLIWSVGSFVAVATIIIGILGWMRIKSIITSKVNEMVDSKVTARLNHHEENLASLLEKAKADKADTDKQIELIRLFEKGCRHADLGKYREAIEAYSRALVLKPNDGMIYNNRGDAKGKIGDYRGALEDFNMAVQIMPNEALIYNNRGMAKKGLGDIQGALADFNMAILINPTEDDAHNNRGNIKSDLGDFVGAILDYDHAITLNPTKAGFYNNRGNAKCSIGDYAGAIEDYDTALALDSRFARAYYNKARVVAINRESVTNVCDLLARCLDIDKTAQMHAQTDEDFAAYRNEREFRALVGLPPL